MLICSSFSKFPGFTQQPGVLTLGHSLAHQDWVLFFGNVPVQHIFGVSAGNYY
mgnify:CR=1 FL=1